MYRSGNRNILKCPLGLHTWTGGSRPTDIPKLQAQLCHEKANRSNQLLSWVVIMNLKVEKNEPEFRHEFLILDRFTVEFLHFTVRDQRD